MMHLLWLDYAMIVLPGILLTVWANARIARAYVAASRVASASGLTGAEAAAEVMQASGVRGVEIAPASGELSNHYDPSRGQLRLSKSVYEGDSLAAVGAAVHEAGHAIQDVAAYPGLTVRNVVVPWTNLGSQVVWLLFIAGLVLGMMRLIVLAIGLFYLILLIQLINLPVELDASRRGREFLRSTGVVSGDEDPLVTRVSSAAALTYVAATLTGGFSILDGLIRFTSSGRGSVRARGLKD
jgi:Zn-dependent membrane protease YugP